MIVMADICVVPLGTGISVSNEVAACIRVFEEAGLEPRMHGYGTNVQGEWDVVFGALKRCHEVVHKMGSPRITTSIRCGTRVDRDQTVQDKIDSVEEKLGHSVS